MPLHDTLPEGKVPWDLIEDKVCGALPPEVLLGPGAGEDAALVRFGGETWAVACDPISFTTEDAGRLAVIVNANDVAVRGAAPAFFLAVVLLAPDEALPERIQALLAQIRDTCQRLGVALIGGHTEVTPGLGQSLLVGTMLGRVQGEPITTGGLREGDWVGMSKWAGLEGTSILLAELGEKLRDLHGPGAFRDPREIFPGEWLTVVPEAAVAARNPAVSALHDVTEGGVGEALFELSRASGLDLDVRPEEIPVLPETKLICSSLGIDPLGLIGSGALLVGCGEQGKDELARALSELGVPFAWIGKAVAPRPRPGPRVPRFERDELLKARLLDGIEAFLFDMDGTLIDSGYDWPAIRRRLDVPHSSTIIDHLNGLESPEREDRWEALRAIERETTRSARPKEGAGELLAFLGERGIRTALVTNNDQENTRFLLGRFGFTFDVVLTRDSGLWKPSGAPLAEAIRRLGVSPERALVVGDSSYDVRAGRDAACGRICLLHTGPGLPEAAVDLTFPDIPAFLRYLRLVL